VNLRKAPGNANEIKMKMYGNRPTLIRACKSAVRLGETNHHGRLDDTTKTEQKPHTHQEGQKIRRFPSRPTKQHLMSQHLMSRYMVDKIGPIDRC